MFLTKKKLKINFRSGQSLIEILIAVIFITFVIISVSSVMIAVIRVNSDSGKIQASTSLANQLLSYVKNFAHSNWYNITSLAHDGTIYYLATTTNGFVAVTGTKSIVASSTIYYLGFSVFNVYRNSNGDIDSNGTTLDPSVQKVNVYYSWLNSATYTISMYLTRYYDNALIQNDFSGGPGQNGPITIPNNMFASSTNIDYTSVTKAIIIRGL
jgi:hypothetical protein